MPSIHLPHGTPMLENPQSETGKEKKKGKNRSYKMLIDRAAGGNVDIEIVDFIMLRLMLMLVLVFMLVFSWTRRIVGGGQGKGKKKDRTSDICHA